MIKQGVVRLRELKHDFHDLWPIPICFFAGLILGAAAICVRVGYRVFGSKPLEKNSEIWIDLSSMQRFSRLLILARRSGIKCIDYQVKQDRIRSTLSIATQVFYSAMHKKPLIRVFCRSGDHGYWAIALVRFMSFVILDIYDTRSSSDNLLRKFLERSAIKSANWLSCRDMRVSGGLGRREITAHKRTLLLDPPYFSASQRASRTIRLKDARVINVGWVGPPDTQYPMIETYKLLLNLGINLTILPSTTQTWKDSTLKSYTELAEEYKNLKLLEPVALNDLPKLLLANDFGLLASDWEWNEMAPSSALADDSPQRDKGIRLTDYVAAGLGVITCRRKWFARRFALRFAHTVIDLNDIQSGWLTQDSLIAVGGYCDRINELEVMIAESIRRTHLAQPDW